MPLVPRARARALQLRADLDGRVRETPEKHGAAAVQEGAQTGGGPHIHQDDDPDVSGVPHAHGNVSLRQDRVQHKELQTESRIMAGHQQVIRSRPGISYWRIGKGTLHAFFPVKGFCEGDSDVPTIFQQCTPYSNQNMSCTYDNNFISVLVGSLGSSI